MENQPQVVTPETENDVVVVDQYDTEALKKNLTTTLEQKRHWREKAKKESEEKAALQARIKEFEEKANSQKLETTEKVQSPADFDTLADNLAVLRNLSDDEVNELRTEAKNLKIDPVQYIKSKGGQAHLNEYRRVATSKESTPAPSGRIPVFNGKPVNQIFTSDASKAEKQAAWEALTKRKGANNSI